MNGAVGIAADVARKRMIEKMFVADLIEALGRDENSVDGRAA